MMPSRRSSISLAILCFLALINTSTAPTTRPDDWRLVWADDFSGNKLDATHWGFDLGNGFTDPSTKQFVAGWGNQELEDYTNRPDNVFVKDGMLHLRASAENYQGFHYTSARLTTKGLFSQVYGRFEIRAKLPTGQGIWPAIWMMPADEAYGGWAASGEIDIMEARGQLPGEVVGSIHYGAAWPGNTETASNYALPQGESISDFHVYALEWEPGVMRWYVDDKLYSTKRWWWSYSKPRKHNRWPAPFDKPFYLLINLSVGGNFAGDPDPRYTTLPQEMVVDYVRVYDKGDYGPLQPPATKDVRPRN